MAKTSVPTGLYVECPHATTHHPRGQAVPVMKGQKHHFWRCSCGANGFCPPGFDGKGMTYQQAIARGLDVPTVFV